MTDYMMTDRLREVMRIANDAACIYKGHMVGTWHLLIGIVTEGSSVSAHMLPLLAEVQKQMLSPNAHAEIVVMPRTGLLTKVIDGGSQYRRKFGHRYLGVDHVMLSLTDFPESPAGLMLRKLNRNLDTLHHELLRALGREEESVEELIQTEVWIA